MLRRTPQRSWTDTETAELMRLYDLGLIPKEIAPRLGRTISSVENKLRDRKLYSEGAVVAQAPDRINSDDRKHLGQLYQANGYGFAWLSDAAMSRIYSIEKAPRRGNEFWRAA